MPMKEASVFLLTFFLEKKSYKKFKASQLLPEASPGQAAGLPANAQVRPCPFQIAIGVRIKWRLRFVLCETPRGAVFRLVVFMVVTAFLLEE
jgi:hypothetical protein